MENIDETKDNLYSFIKAREKNLSRIVAYKQSCDISDENHSNSIQVVCEICVPNRNIPLNNLAGRVTRTCIIDQEVFNRWVKNKNALKWIG